MYLISASPLLNSHLRELSYFSATPFEKGTVIEAPLRGKKIRAVVTLSENVREAKAELRSASFEVKKVGEKDVVGTISKSIFVAAEKTSVLFGSSIGEIVGDMIADSIFSHLKPEPEKKPGAIFILQGEEEDRFTHYRNVIREAFAKKRSTTIVTPIAEECDRVRETLGRGIENFVYVLSSELTKKEQEKRTLAALSNPHPIVLICTPSFAGLPRNDIDTAIIESENSPSYEEIFTGTRFDKRFFLENMFRERGCRSILGDILLRPETIARFFDGETQEIIPPSWRIAKDRTIEIVNMNKEAEAVGKIMSQRVIDTIRETRHNLENVFVFVPRRGLHTGTACGDCGRPLICTCGKPLVLHEERGVRFYLCHTCGKTLKITKDKEVLCPTCGSWRLYSFGIGTQNVKSIMEKFVPKQYILTIDSDSVNKKEARKAAEKFYEGRGLVLIGTEMAIPYLRGKFSKGIVVSLDPIFAVGSYHAYERILSVVAAITEKTDLGIIIQTRLRHEKVFSYLESKNVQEFYREELSVRKNFSYPPFGYLVYMRFEEQIPEETIKGVFSPYEVLFYDKKKRLMGALAKVPKDAWGSGKIQEKIKNLGASIKISVNENFPD